VTAVVPCTLRADRGHGPHPRPGNEFGLIVVEDACQAHGAEYLSKTDGRLAQGGSMGHAAVFSFYPARIWRLRRGGRDHHARRTPRRALPQAARSRPVKKYFHDMGDTNGRLDAIQAGMPTVKLRYSRSGTSSAESGALVYDELFANADATVTIPHVPACRDRSITVCREGRRRGPRAGELAAAASARASTIRARCT